MEAGLLQQSQFHGRPDSELQKLRNKLQIETKHRRELTARCDQLEEELMNQDGSIKRLEQLVIQLQAQLQLQLQQQQQQQQQPGSPSTPTPQNTREQESRPFTLTLDKRDGSFGELKQGL